MQITPNTRETRNCAARLSLARPTRAHKRCGVAALDFGDVRVAGRLVEIPLCRAHFRKLRDSPDPAALALDWAPDPA
jgi:hypothetical protein